MSEGGTLAWKRQSIDTSRGPAGTYEAIHRKLPDLPEGVTWHHNPKTREWTLVRAGLDEAEARQRIYRWQQTTTWNPHTGREQAIVTPVLRNDNNPNETDTVATEGSNSDNDDDEDFADTPSPPVLGKDYVVHTVLPSDTFSGLCLRYQISALQLRQVNQFSGTNLNLAPPQLIIPLTSDAHKVRFQDTDSHEYKLQAVRNAYPKLVHVECKAYLEMNDWDLEQTLDDIKNDVEWEEQGQRQQGKSEDQEVSKKTKNEEVYEPLLSAPQSGGELEMT